MASSEPLFHAVTGNARQIYLLLRSIHFTTTAHVSITESGIHFLTEDSRIIQGAVLIEKSLFSSYIFKPPADPSDEDGGEGGFDGSYSFKINLTVMLETLRVLGLSAAGNLSRRYDSPGFSAAMIRTGPATALNNRVLGAAAICRMNYLEDGAPLNIILEENGMTTTCALTTYEPETEVDSDIPFHRDRLMFKVIMRASLLLSAVAQLDSTSPTRLVVSVSPRDPNLVFSAVGPLSSASVEFRKDKQLLDTFHSGGVSSSSYKFSMVKAAARAMAMSSKVSIRADENGVLNLQFIAEGDNQGKLGFIDFKYRALIEEDEEEGANGGEEGADEEEIDAEDE